MNLPNRHKQSGMALIESLIAVLIFVIGILGLMGLQATMLQNTVDARYRAEAGYVAQKRIAQIWATDVANRGTLAEQGTDISAETGLPGGQRDTLRGAPEQGCDGNPACFIVEVRWTMPNDPAQPHRYSIVSHIQ